MSNAARSFAYQNVKWSVVLPNPHTRFHIAIFILRGSYTKIVFKNHAVKAGLFPGSILDHALVSLRYQNAFSFVNPISGFAYEYQLTISVSLARNFLV